ncbi:MAG: hypothetical protein ABIF17_01340 [Patescibacteria group bacterium]
MTWRNERAVEIPIFLPKVLDYNGKKILEVGNVLSHYTYFDHDIVDKYEKAKGVLNEDAAFFKSSKKYDLIISISTLEHIGVDETKKEPKKSLVAIKNLIDNLSIGGELLVSFPIGYNKVLDELISKNSGFFTERNFLKRFSVFNFWKQVSWEEVKDSKFAYPFPCANGLFIGIFKK